MEKNNKGYMLVEIILAFVIAFAVVFFIINLTIRLKNKNDDTLVESLVITDSSIVSNKLMEHARLEKDNFDCSNVTIDGNNVKYNKEVIDIFTEYAQLGNVSCSTDMGNISIFIPVTVKQLPGKDFDININYKYRIDDYTFPQIELRVNEGTTYKKSNTGILTINDNDGIMPGEYTIKYYWSMTGGKTCKDMPNSKKVRVNAGDKKVQVEIPASGGTGKGKLYVCNLEAISDKNGNTMPQTIYDAVMYLDNTGPVFEYKMDGIFTAVVECKDNDVDKEKGVLKTQTQDLSGTADVTVSKNCTDSLGNTAIGTHVYKYSNCARGENTCQRICNVCSGYWVDTLNCPGYGYCNYAYHVYYYDCEPCDSCGSGHNTCEKGFVVN